MEITLDVLKTAKLTVSTRELSVVLGIDIGEVTPLMERLGISPLISMFTRSRTTATKRDYKRWSLPQVIERLSNWEQRDKPVMNFTRQRMFRQEDVKNNFSLVCGDKPKADD